MSKHYNLTVTDDNGKSVTTSNTSTEHPEEVLRMMQLAGMQSEPQCGMESVEENEYQPTPANDKLDLEDYSKKSGESIPKQKKSLDKAPSRGDNPLEYSLDENEIFESLMNEFKVDVEEGKLNPGLQAYLDKKKGKKDDKDDKEKTDEKAKPDFADIDGDGDKKETMKKAAKDKSKKKANEGVEEISEKVIKEATCGCNPEGDCCKDNHSKEEIGQVCECCGNDIVAVANEEQINEEKCRYCGGDCPDDPNHACDGFIGDIDNLYGSYDKDDEDDMDENADLNRLRKLANLPEKTDEVQEGSEVDEVKAILMSYPEDVEKMKQMGDIDTGSQLYMDLFGFYQDEMPYGTQKARDGDPVEWIMNRLDDLGMTEDKQVDEVGPLAVLAPVAKAVGGALLKKGIKGTAARAGASAVASKMMSKPSSNVQ
tara:strand:+ start:1142 stop:2419 length:1278 start_codon:yes stop_codon:yes gene_type:complete